MFTNLYNNQNIYDIMLSEEAECKKSIFFIITMMFKLKTLKKSLFYSWNKVWEINIQKY